MTQTIRISLPGYDALTDTNLDHFALHADSDNVLIKEFSRGSIEIVSVTGEDEELIAHDLGYVPFFLVYVLDTNDSKWKLVPHFQGIGSVPDYAAFADTSDLHIINFSATTTFKYYIFYDNVVGSSGITLAESDKVIKITKAGYNAATETDPNNMIFHSDLNTFKILKEGNASITYTADGNYTVAHSLSGYTPTSILVFIEFPDGFTALIPGSGTCYSKDGNFSADSVFVDSTNINLTINRISGTDTAINIKYYIFETPLA